MICLLYEWKWMKNETLNHKICSNVQCTGIDWHEQKLNFCKKFNRFSRIYILTILKSGMTIMFIIDESEIICYNSICTLNKSLVTGKK